MRKLFILLIIIFIISSNCKKGDNNVSTSSTVNSENKEINNESLSSIDTIKLYYKRLSNIDTLELAYEMSTKKVDFEKFKSWYSNIQEITLGELKEVEPNTFNFIVTFIEFGENKNDITTTYFDITMRAEKGKIISSTAKPVIDDYSKLGDIDIIKLYYKFMANNETIDKAYEMSVKKVSFEKYKEWYQSVKSITLSQIEEIEAHKYYFIVNFTETDRNFTQYSVTMGVKDGKIVSSESREVSNPENITDGNTIDEDYYGLGGKPVIYLYPENQIDIKISVGTKFGLYKSEPLMNESWNVTAYPDGTIINKNDNNKYKYLFWEAIQNQIKSDFNRGFCVKRDDLGAFFDTKLRILGLNTIEINDFKEFWLKELNSSKYYLITFIDIETINLTFPLNIEPEPDSIIRVFFDSKGVDKKTEIKEQKLVPLSRKGFSVIEWGGMLYQ